MWEWQGLMDSNHRMTESESVALPLGEAPIKKALHWSAVHNVLSAEGLYRMAGVDGIKPPFADLESAVLLTELNSLKSAGKQAGVAPAWQVFSLPETAGYRHKKALHWSAVHNVS